MNRNVQDIIQLIVNSEKRHEEALRTLDSAEKKLTDAERSKYQAKLLVQKSKDDIMFWVGELSRTMERLNNLK